MNLKQGLEKPSEVALLPLEGSADNVSLRTRFRPHAFHLIIRCHFAPYWVPGFYAYHLALEFLFILLHEEQGLNEQIS